MNFRINSRTRMKRSVLFALLVLLGGSVINKSYGQRVQYTQYHQTPLLTNPADGAMSNYASVTLGYRSYKVAASDGLNIPTLSVLYPIFSVKKGDSTRTGYAGLVVLSDRSKDNGNTSLTGGAVSYGHNVKLTSKGDKLAVGLQLGYYQRQFDQGKYTTGSQFNQATGNYDSNLDKGLNLKGNSSSNLIVNVGATYYREDEANGRVKHYLGFSAQNVTQPDFSLVNSSTDKMPAQFITTGGYSISVPETPFVFTPTFRNIANSSKDYQTNVGVLSHYWVKEGFMAGGNFGVGLWYSTGKSFENNAPVVSLEANHKNFTVAFSYDYTTSDLAKGTSNASAQEIIVGLRSLIGRSKPAGPKKEIVLPKTKQQIEDSIKLANELKAKQERDAKVVQERIAAEKKAAEEREKLAAEERVRQQRVADSLAKIKVKPVKPVKPDKPVKPVKPVKPGRRKPAGGGVRRPGGGRPGAEKPYRGNLTAAQRKLLAQTPLYAFNQATLTERDKEILDSIALLMQAKPDLRLQINGHADNIGGDAVNYRISQARADAAVDYIKGKGIGEDRLTTKAYGKTTPIATNATESGRAKNRRVEFKVIK